MKVSAYMNLYFRYLEEIVKKL